MRVQFKKISSLIGLVHLKTQHNLLEKQTVNDLATFTGDYQNILLILLDFKKLKQRNFN